MSSATDGPVHVSVGGRPNLVEIDGVTFHRPRQLSPGDLVPHLSFRMTTPERTVLDLLTTKSVTELTRMLEQMITTLGRSPDHLHAWGAGVGQRVPGRRHLTRALDNVAGPAVIRSEFESLFRSVCQEGLLPQARTNHRIGHWETDAVWIHERVAVELDSWRFHGGRWQFHQDRRKGLAISRAGFELIRLSWPQLKYDRDEVIETLALALARGRARAAHASGGHR